MTLVDHLINKVIIYLDMLATTVKNKINNKTGGRDVVTKESYRNSYQNTHV